MKKLFLSLTLVAGLGCLFTACSDEFLEKEPQGTLRAIDIANLEGLENLLVGAYAQLDGWTGWAVGAPWTSAASNWTYADVYADDAYKGSDAGDQADILLMERYVQSSTNPYMNGKWRAVYDGVARCNDVMNILALAKSEGTIKDADATQIEAEARFLRAHYHLDAVQVFDNVPYVTEASTDGLVSNPSAPYAQIEADFQFAIDNLPETPRNGQLGRATQYAAHGLMARTKLMQGNYSDALPHLNGIINSMQYSLTPNFHTNFNCDGDNSSEAVFQIQASINDGSGEGANGNYGDILNFPYTGGPGACCGFYQPSQNLVNAYQTDADGLPLINTFNDNDVVGGQDCSYGGDDPFCCNADDDGNCIDAFVPEAGNLDPRLDWTVGRKAIPYLDWGRHPGRAWIRDQAFAGPYSPIKNVYYASEEGSCSNAGGWGGGTTGNNYSILRYADILLMAAECEVEVGDLDIARGYVNEVRSRASNSDYFVKDDTGADAANYVIGTYDNSWSDQNAARDAVRFERRLELAMEGHRMFDLVRWGTAKEVITTYLAKESQSRTYLAGSAFQDHHVRQPIPQSALDESQGTLSQNPGY